MYASFRREDLFPVAMYLWSARKKLVVDESSYDGL